MKLANTLAVLGGRSHGIGWSLTVACLFVVLAGVCQQAWAQNSGSSPFHAEYDLLVVDTEPAGGAGEWYWALGDGQATHLGQSTFGWQSADAYAEYPTIWTSGDLSSLSIYAILVSADGDELIVSGPMRSSDGTHFEGNLDFVGGSGRFFTANGYCSATVVDMHDGRLHFEMDGLIHHIKGWASP